MKQRDYLLNKLLTLLTLLIASFLVLINSIQGLALCTPPAITIVTSVPRVSVVGHECLLPCTEPGMTLSTLYIIGIMFLARDAIAELVPGCHLEQLCFHTLEFS